MSNVTPVSLPTIDFSKVELQPGADEWNLVKSQVWKAIDEYGCFQVSYDKVPLEVQKAFLNELKELFDLPIESKTRSVSDRPFQTYHRNPSNEVITIDDCIPENIQSLSDLMWPNGKPGFSNVVHSFTAKVSELIGTIMKMVLESMGLEKYLEGLLKSSKVNFRAMKYLSSQPIETEIVFPVHTDLNTLTILYQNSVDGLEVQTKDGEWVKMKFSPEASFVVLVGESFHAWTNGRLHPPFHRVGLSGNKPRYSAGWFLASRVGHLVTVPDELVDEEHPLQYKPFDFWEFLAFFQSPQGMKYLSSLKDFCGVQNNSC